MRTEFVTGLMRLVERDERIVLLTADLGWGVLDEFVARFPQRFINVGVAEQAMIGVATGLASKGFIPYCYSIASFSIGRTFEFLRNGPAAHGLPVRVIGIGPGFDYSHDGFTHYALEDIGLLLNQPNTRIVAPRDSASAERFGEQGFNFSGLVYVRLAKTTSAVPMDALADPWGRVLIDHVVVVALGDAVATGRQAVERLKGRGVTSVLVEVEVVDRASIKALIDRIAATASRRVVVAENHYARGGFGTMLSDELAVVDWKGRIWKLGITGFPGSDTGTLAGMSARHMTDLVAVAEQVAADVGA